MKYLILKSWSSPNFWWAVCVHLSLSTGLSINSRRFCSILLHEMTFKPVCVWLSYITWRGQNVSQSPKWQEKQCSATWCAAGEKMIEKMRWCSVLPCHYTSWLLLGDFFSSHSWGTTACWRRSVSEGKASPGGRFLRSLHRGKTYVGF